MALRGCFFLFTFRTWETPDCGMQLDPHKITLSSLFLEKQCSTFSSPGSKSQTAAYMIFTNLPQHKSNKE